ncbi:hypothetical protein BZM27_06460 [Paraburkholderia steynii]|uniref:Uncharacterized protein n=1 Tax=Paraburkholderia steynii TaxID=1245441 RepID=A0A4R0XP06_9BURK|nr:hypothetical protein BZM27_06460 [Paraburkholderia steynii]
MAGLSKSLSRHLQGISASRAAQLECELYSRTLSVDRFVKYGMPSIDRRIAVQQAADLKDVLDILDEEIAAADKRLRTGNGTLSDLLTLRLQRDQMSTQYVAAKIEKHIRAGTGRAASGSEAGAGPDRRDDAGSSE